MRRKIIINEVEEINFNIKNLMKKLVEAKKKTLNDIGRIREFYQGKDAEEIISNYTFRVNLLDEILLNYFNYSKYIEKATGVYNDNVKKAIKDFNELMAIEPKQKDNIMNSSLSFDVFSNDITENGEENLWQI